jgi:Ca2+-transporting ATPase
VASSARLTSSTPSFAASLRLPLCATGAQLEYKNDAYKCVGEPTEGALKVLCEKIGLDDMRGVAKKRSSKPEQHAQIVCDTIESCT